MRLEDELLADELDPRTGELRVLELSDYLFESSSGGIEKATWEVSNQLSTLGVSVKALTAFPSAKPGSSKLGSIEVVRVRALNVGRTLGVQMCFAPGLVTRALRMVDEFRPHVIHANGLHFQTSIAAAIVHRLRGIPMVTTVQVGSLDHLPFGVRLLTTVYERTVGRWILNGSEKVIAVSPSVASHVRSLGVPDERIHVIPNGVDLERFGAISWQERTSEPPIVVFVGRMISNKGPELLVNALATLHKNGVSFKAVFVGEGPQRPHLEQMVLNAGLAGLVRFVGPVADVAPWLADASIMVRPSLTEGLPLAILEAMAGGVLVVASDISGNNELISHGDTGLLFPAGEASQLAERLQFALENHDTCVWMVSAARAASMGYSWDTCAASILKVLAESASRAHR